MILIDLDVRVGREGPHCVEIVGHIVGKPIDGLASDLHAGNEIVTEGAGIESEIHLGLIGIDPCGLIAVGMVHIRNTFHGRRDIVEAALSGSRPVGQRHALGQLGNHRSRDDVGLLLEEVEPQHADPGLARDAELGHRHVVDVASRHAPIGDGVVAIAIIVEGDLYGIGEPRRGRQETAPALAFGDIAAGDVVMVVHEVGAKREVRRHLLVGVERRAEHVVGAERGRHLIEARPEIRLLADDIDRAADGAAAGDTAARTLVDLDLLDGKHVGNDVAGIANAVDENVVAGLEAADGEGAIGISAFGGADGQPRRRTGEVAQIACALVLDDLLGSDGDGSRRIDERFGQLARSGLLDLVGCLWIGVGVGALLLGGQRRGGSGRRNGNRRARLLGGCRRRLLLLLLGLDAERRQGRSLRQCDRRRARCGKARRRHQRCNRGVLLGGAGACRLADRTAKRTGNADRTHFAP